jgi:hypothetical protein
VKTNKEILHAIETYQSCPLVHPMTCGNDSNHSILEGAELDEKVILFCTDCDYSQSWIPEFIWHAQVIIDDMKNNFPDIYDAIMRNTYV